jgi:hypothetical protein
MKFDTTISPEKGSIVVVKVPQRETAIRAAEQALIPFAKKYGVNVLIVPYDWDISTVSAVELREIVERTLLEMDEEELMTLGLERMFDVGVAPPGPVG